jgi:hypothetical protein
MVVSNVPCSACDRPGYDGVQSSLFSQWLTRVWWFPEFPVQPVTDQDMIVSRLPVQLVTDQGMVVSRVPCSASDRSGYGGVQGSLFGQWPGNGGVQGSLFSQWLTRVWWCPGFPCSASDWPGYGGVQGSLFGQWPGNGGVQGSLFSQWLTRVRWCPGLPVQPVTDQGMMGYLQGFLISQWPGNGSVHGSLFSQWLTRVRWCPGLPVQPVTDQGMMGYRVSWSASDQGMVVSMVPCSASEWPGNGGVQGPLFSQWLTRVWWCPGPNYSPWSLHANSSALLHLEWSKWQNLITGLS